MPKQKKIIVHKHRKTLKKFTGFAVVGLLLVGVFNFLALSNKPAQPSNLTPSALTRLTDINTLAETYEKEAVNGKYSPLKSSNFNNSKLPNPDDGTSYQGLLDTTASSYAICTPMDPKDKNINCFDKSQNTKCYCRYSKKALVSPSPSPSPSSPTDICQAVTSTNPTVVIKDGFNRANSTTDLGNADTGQAWEVLSGKWGVLDNAAYQIDYSDHKAVINTGKGDGTLEVTLAKNVQDTRILFRTQDSNNTYLVERDGWGYHMEKVVNGQRYELTPRSANAAMTDGDKVRIDMSGQCIKTYINDALLLDVKDSSFTGTRHGIGTYFSPEGRFDDYYFQYPLKP